MTKAEIVNEVAKATGIEKIASLEYIQNELKGVGNLAK